MFGQRKKELELIQKILDAFEKSQSNHELALNSFHQFVSQNTQKEEVEELIDSKVAAYALNLCMVSVSQIVDYNDENILEQEYETILNNLNLEHMPKDEELLLVLKQLFDTITFFRIQEGDKRLIEKAYQQKMKDAIWASVPGLGLLVAGGNPVTMALSLASQVGIGYMNYRKVKADNQLGKECKEWELQRVAIEQFNGLRRELFDAAWRLAAKYRFKDEYRLTERQITQYNRILMDGDNYRRHDRLLAIKENFEAYPPFWYYLGHAANLIAQEENKLGGDKEIHEKYQKLAREHFDRYMTENVCPLLREDHITSSCALEYNDLLDPVKDRQKIWDNLELAIKLSGKECDILQLCCMDYLKIKDYRSAVDILKYLVNEEYNTIINAQILSSILVIGYMKQLDIGIDFSLEYKMLSKKVNKELLFPMPTQECNELKELENNFLNNQRKILSSKYGYVIKHYIQKKQVEFNRAIPEPYENREYPDSFYLDDEDSCEKRFNEYKKALISQDNRIVFGKRLSDSDFVLVYLDIFNSIVNDLSRILPDDSDKDDVIERLVNLLKDKILAQKECLNSMIFGPDKEFSVEALDNLFDMSFGKFTEEFFAEYLYIIDRYVETLDSMEAFSLKDTMLLNFCDDYGIPEYKAFLGTTGSMYSEDTGEHVYFEGNILGEEFVKKEQQDKLLKRMVKMLNEHVAEILCCETRKKENNFMYTREDSNKKSYNEYLKKHYKKDSKFVGTIAAILEDKSIMFPKNLIFTTEGIVIEKLPLFTTKYPYAEVRYNGDDGLLVFGTGDKPEKYDNPNINLNVLNKVIQSFAEMVQEVENNLDDVDSTDCLDDLDGLDSLVQYRTFNQDLYLETEMEDKL